MLNLILSVQLTARGDSVRGFISAVDLSLRAKKREREKRRGGLCELTFLKKFLFFSLAGGKKSCLILLYGI